MSSVYIILVNYNGFKDTCECIESIKKNTFRDYKIIVVDNASCNDEAGELQRAYPSVRVIASKKNLGFAKANNIGLRIAKDENADYALLLNNDTVVNADFLERMHTDCINNNIDVLTCKIAYYTNKNSYWYAGGEFSWKKGYGIHYHDKRMDGGIAKVDFSTGCCLMLSRQIFSRYLLPEEYFMYFEDVDYCLCLEANGISIFYDPNIIILHKISASTGIESPFFVYYWNRNRIILIKKFYTNRKKIVILIKLFVTRIFKIFLYAARLDSQRIKAMIKGCISGSMCKVE